MPEPDVLPVTRLPTDSLPETVLVCGDPGRAERIAGHFAGSRLLARNREYHTHVGTYGGLQVACASHGIGAPGAAIAFEELIRAGARRLIRLGTCGTFLDDLDVGDALIPTAAAREDGLTARLVPAGFPAVADPGIAQALAASAEDAGVRFARGIVLSNDAFYAGPLGSTDALYAACGVIGVEMECSALFVVATLRGARAAALLVIDGHPLRRADHAAEYQPRTQRMAEAIDRAIDVVLRTASGIG